MYLFSALSLYPTWYHLSGRGLACSIISVVTSLSNDRLPLPIANTTTGRFLIQERSMNKAARQNKRTMKPTEQWLIDLEAELRLEASADLIARILRMASVLRNLRIHGLLKPHAHMPHHKVLAIKAAMTLCNELEGKTKKWTGLAVSYKLIENLGSKIQRRTINILIIIQKK
jgi:hypothetical protein